MAAQTGTGLWVVADQTSLNRTAGTFTQGQAPIPASTPAQQGLLNWLSSTGSGSSSTTVPTVPAFTKYPVTP